jgi:hypothetical protein
MSLGNGNPKEGDKGSNFNYELKALQGLDSIAKKLETGIVKKIIAGTGITISPASGTGNVTINSSAVGPTTLTFGGVYNYTEGSELYAYNNVTTIQTLYSGSIFQPSKNYWIDLTIQTYPTVIGGNFTVRLYASATGATNDILLATYTVNPTVAGTMYKMKRSFSSGYTINTDSGDTNYMIVGAPAATSLNTDELTSTWGLTSIGLNTASIQYPYLNVTVQGSLTTYRLGPSRITYG